MSIKWKLVLSLFALSAFPLFIGIGVVRHIAVDGVIHQVTKDLEAISKIQSSRVKAAFERYEEATSLIASRTQMRMSFYKFSQSTDQASYEKVKAEKIEDESVFINAKDLRSSFKF